MPIALCVGLVGLSACGGIATKDDTKTAASDCGETLTVGAPYPLSGPLAEFGQNSLHGMEVAAEQINAAGGIKALGGAQLKIVPADTSSGDPSQASSATTQLISSDKAVALVGSWLSNLTLSGSTVAENSRTPIVTQSWADALTDRGYQYIFQITPKSSEIGAASTEYVLAAAKQAGLTFGTVAAVGPNDVANIAQIKGAMEALGKAGMKTSEPNFYQPGISDVNPIVNRVAAQKPDLVLASGSPSDATLIVRGLRARGINVPILGFGGAFVARGLATGLGDGVNGIIAVSAWNDDLPLPGVKEAAEMYTKKYDLPFMAMEAGESWVATYVVKEALEKAASCQPDDVATALRELDFTSGPASAMPGDGGVTFDKTGANPNADPILIQWQDGRPRTIWPQKYATTPFTAGK